MTLLGGAHLRPLSPVRDEAAASPLERKTAALLAYLALEGPTDRSTLAGLLWPSVVESKARNNLRQCLHRMRAHPGSIQGSGELALGAALQVDLCELLEADAHGDATAISERWGHGSIALLRGHAYDDCAELAEWIALAQERIDALVLRAIEREVGRLEEEGALAAAVALTNAQLRHDPLSEGTFRRLMRLHYLRGDRARALDAYHRCARMLRSAFGVAPLPDTEELARTIDRSVLPRAARPSARPTPARYLRPPRLVGRRDAWATLEAAWDRVSTIVILGPPGIGKSRLLADFCRAKGGPVPTRGIPGEEHVPFATIARALDDLLGRSPDLPLAPWVRAELSRILPGRFAMPAGVAPIRDATGLLRLYRAMAAVLDRVADRSPVLASDDLHLWDDASFAFGVYFAAHLRPGAVHSLHACRLDALTPARRTALDRLTGAGLARTVTLGPLEPDAVAELVQEVTGTVPSAPLLPELLRVGTGNPLDTLEMLRTLRASPGPRGGGARHGTPGAQERRSGS